MRKLLPAFLLFVSSWFTVFSAQVITIPGLVRPADLVIDRNQFFISDFPHVYFYSLQDFTLQHKIGGKGEGPQEFRGYMTRVQARPDCIIVNSLAKSSYFKRDGTYIKEIRLNSGKSMMIKPLGDGYAAYELTLENGIEYVTVNIYGSDLNIFKEVYRCSTGKQTEGLRRVFNVLDYNRLACRGSENRLVVMDIADFKLYIFNEKGEKLTTISRDYHKLKVTDRDKEAYYDYFKTHPMWKDVFEETKKTMKFYSHFPPIRGFDFDGNIIYVYTFKKKGNDTEFFIFDMDGKLLKKAFLPLNYNSVVDAGPYSLYRWKLYQLIENGEKEEWELHITDIN